MGNNIVTCLICLYRLNYRRKSTPSTERHILVFNNAILLSYFLEFLVPRI